MALQEFTVGNISLLLDVSGLTHVVKTGCAVNYSLSESCGQAYFGDDDGETLANEMYRLIKQAWSVQREIAEQYRNRMPTFGEEPAE